MILRSWSSITWSTTVYTTERTLLGTWWNAFGNIVFIDSWIKFGNSYEFKSCTVYFPSLATTFSSLGWQLPVRQMSCSAFDSSLAANAILPEHGSLPFLNTTSHADIGTLSLRKFSPSRTTGRTTCTWLTQDSCSLKHYLGASRRTELSRGALHVCSTPPKVHF